MVFMIICEDHSRKPYAIPIQCVPYVGMNETNARKLIKAIIKAMVDGEMKVAGIFEFGCLGFNCHVIFILLQGLCLMENSITFTTEAIDGLYQSSP